MEAKPFPFCYGRLFALYMTYVASVNTKKNSWQQSLHKLEENCMGSQLYERSYLISTLHYKAKRMLFLTHPLLRMWWGERVRTWLDPQTLLSQDLLQEFNTLQLYTTSEPHHLCDDHWWSPKKKHKKKKTKSSDPFICKY